MDKVILIICYKKYWQVRIEKDNFSLDCKSEKAAFNCACQLICFEAGKIDHLKLQMEDDSIQGTWTCREFDNMVTARYPNLNRHKLVL